MLGAVLLRLLREGAGAAGGEGRGRACSKGVAGGQKRGAGVRGGSSQVPVHLNQVWSFCLLAVVLSVKLYWVENTYFV